MLAPEHPLRGLEGLLEGGRDLGQLFGRYVFVKSKGPRIPPLEVERGLRVILGSGGPGLLYLYKRVCRPPGGRGGAGEG
jgi:hypothetical protein